VVTVSWLYSFFGGTNEKAMLVSDIILFFSPQFSHQPADHKMWRKWIAPSARYFLSTLTCALSSQVNDVKMVQSINIFFVHQWQIVGTSKNFQKRKKQQVAMASDSEDSYSSSSSHARYMKKNNINNENKVRSFSPSTPPPTPASYRTAKRRKGIPHRAPMGGLIIEY